MHPWDCCRTCLATQSLNPIFTLADHHEKYTSVIYIATGIKVDINDNLPQKICSPCINFINECYKFRKKCEDSQKTLQNRFNNKDLYVKESETFKSEDKISIDISDLIVDSFSDLDDNITLDEYQYNYKLETNKEDILQVYETTVKDIVEKPLEIVFNKKKERAVKRKVKSKKENKEEKRTKEKADRVREEIECEYCHKILTSKLSLRNHYKIHTGFDVVCEHCGKKFITRRLLLMHCRAKHGYEKTDKCSYCDYKASNAEQVKIHERLHTGEKPYSCSDCGAGFHRKSSYLQHIAIHLPEKTVQCDQCPALFKSITLMRIHKNRHRAPQYTFRCRVCDNSFARRRNVVRHFQRIHGMQAKEQDIDRVKIG